MLERSHSVAFAEHPPIPEEIDGKLSRQHSFNLKHRDSMRDNGIVRNGTSTFSDDSETKEITTSQDSNELDRKEVLTFVLATGAIISTGFGVLVGVLIHPGALAFMVLGNTTCIIFSEIFLHERKTFIVNDPRSNGDLPA